MGIDSLSESQNRVLKLVFVAQEPNAKVDFVNNLVAMTNAGGGQINFGRNEMSAPGIDHATRSELDSAKLTDAVSRFIRPASIRLSHEVSPLENRRYICRLNVMAADSRY
jgi:hypothetical protein